jgi:hypothetical protein
MRYSSLRVALILSIVTAVFAPTATAQEKTVGLVVGYPIDVGVLWQASARVALRADVGFGFNTFESSQSGLSLGTTARSTLTTTSSSGFATVGLAALFTIRNDDNLRLYLAPRAALDLTHQSNETAIDPPLPSSSANFAERSETSRGYEFDVMFGGQYRLRDRLALFGETGLAYHRSSFPSVSATLTIGGGVGSGESDRDTTTTFFGLRSTVGLVFFF